MSEVFEQCAAPVPPQGTQQLTPDQFAVIIEAHLRVVVEGLAKVNPAVPLPVMGQCVANAMGRLLSCLTVSDDIKATIETRGRLGDIFNHSIRKAYPVTKAANGSGLILPN